MLCFEPLLTPAGVELLHRAGTRAVATVGADDLMLARLLRPRLTTVHMSLPAGEELAELVDRLISDPVAEPVADPVAEPVSRELMTVRLVVRDSG
ncbi:hypothetical protein GCM10023235_26090 [Kitasatospora terrestris]|uniref:Uncharacterized protein n=1 Tax=Kitasatospora terrestris TaxID=258051 RepID=A0ABP9DIW2_9ACTN